MNIPFSLIYIILACAQLIANKIAYSTAYRTCTFNSDVHSLVVSQVLLYYCYLDLVTYCIISFLSVVWPWHLLFHTAHSTAKCATILSTKQPTQCTACRASINATKCTAEWESKYASSCTTHLPTNATSMSFLLLLLSSHVHRLIHIRWTYDINA